MAMTKKFEVFDLVHGGFLNEDGKNNPEIDETSDDRKDYDLLNGAVFTEETAKAKGIDLAEDKYLQVPITESVWNELPIEPVDTAPEVPFGEADPVQREEALKGDFAVMSPYGFYDEWASSDNTSRTKIRAYNLNYANLYTAEDLERIGESDIMKEPSIIVPVTEAQQERLKQLPEFSPEKEPLGFFMKPIGRNPEMQSENAPETVAMDGPSFAEALNNLESQAVTEEELPFSK